MRKDDLVKLVSINKYDKNGNLIEAKQVNGEIVKYTYGSKNMLTSVCKNVNDEFGIGRNVIVNTMYNIKGEVMVIVLIQYIRIML